MTISRSNNFTKAVASAGLALLFCFYYCSVTMFTHSHELGGRVVSHSHPYSKSGHTHSGEFLEALAMLSLVVLLVAAGVAFVKHFAEWRPSHIPYIVARDIPAAEKVNLMRGPPVTA